MSDPGDFWSRRKAAVAAEEEASGAAQDAAALREETAALAEKPEAEVLEELGLPDPDTLEKGDDFSVFLKGPVPEAIRRRALRRLWRTDPVLANLDNLVEYGDDYTKTNLGAEGLKTAYEVGRGFWQKIAAEAEEAAARDAAEVVEEAPVPEASVSAVPADPADTGAADTPGAPDNIESAVAQESDMPKDAEGMKDNAEPQPEVEYPGEFQRRRMAFRFFN